MFLQQNYLATANTTPLAMASCLFVGLLISVVINDTVPLNYNFIVTHLSMSGATRNIQCIPIIYIRVCMGHILSWMEHTHLV